MVTCRYLLELDEAETATVLGWARGTVKSRLHRALRQLAKALAASRDRRRAGSTTTTRRRWTMAVDTEHDALAAELVALGRALPRPEPAARLVRAVTARLADAGPPPASTPLDRLRARAAETFVRRRRQAVVVVTAVAARPACRATGPGGRG